MNRHDVDATLSCGDLEITTLLASVTAKTVYGDLHIRRAAPVDLVPNGVS